jgi:hypothetical protein
MNDEKIVSQVIRLLGANRVLQIRTALNAPDPEKKKCAPINWEARLEAATTLRKCYRISENVNGELWQRTREKINSMLLPMLKAATTAKECLYIFKNAKGELEWKALEKALHLATTMEMFREIERLAYNSRFEEKARIGIDNFLLSKLRAAKTVEACMYAYIHGSSKVEKMAIRKVNRLLCPRLRATTTVRGCIGVYDRGFNELRQKAIKKAMTIATTLAEWKMIFEKTRVNSAEADTCIRAIAAILEKRERATA